MVGEGGGKVDRRARRRARTREQLTGAARTLFARQGVEVTRINEITEEADVGFGSFYNYFESKDAIVEAVLEQTVAAAAARISELTEGFEDPAEVVAVAHRSFVHLAGTEPEWAWLLVRLEVSHNLAFSALGPYAIRDLERGIAEGRFEVPDTTAALVATGGALVGVMRATLDGLIGPGGAEAHAAGVLRLLGMTVADAAEVASRPMPA